MARLGAVVVFLRHHGHPAVADRLMESLAAGAISDEILGLIGQVLREHAGLRRQLNAPARASWDAVARAVRRAWPGWGVRYWLARAKAALAVRRDFS